MICKNCGNENDDSYLFCASCGSPLTVQASQQHVPEAPAETAETAAVKETAETPERAETAETEEKQKPVPADSAQPPASAEAADRAVEVQNHEHASKETPEPAEAAAAGAAEDQPIQAAAAGAAEATPAEAVPPASYQQQQIPQQPFAPYQPQQYQSQYQPQYQSPYQVPYQPRYQPVYPAYQQSPMPYQYGYPAAMVPGYMPKPKATVEKRNKYFIPAFIFGLIAVVFFILNLIERIKENKSLVDIRLTTGTCREFFQNDTDSFILASSDSDYWGLISAMPEAHFLVLVEEEKCSPAIKKAMLDAGITYCYTDDFCTGNSDEIRIQAVLNEVKRALDTQVQFNIQDILGEAYCQTRANLSTAERRQFYERYIKPMRFAIDKDGNVSVQLGPL